MKRHAFESKTWGLGILPAILIAAALMLAPAAVRADLGSALKKAGESVKKGTEDLKEGIEGVRDKHIIQPSTPDEMAKAADKQLKDAQALMFKGEFEKATAGVIDAAVTILALKEANPKHEKLSGLENRANKLAGDLNRRTEQKFDLWAEAKKKTSGEEAAAEAKKEETTGETKPSPDAAPAQTSPAQAEKLPYHAAQAMLEFNKQMRSVDSSYNFIKMYKEEGEPTEKWLVKLDEVDQKIALAEKHLADAREKAAAQNVTAHPDFDAADARVATEKERVAAAREDTKTAQKSAAESKAGVDADVDAFVVEYQRLDEKYFTKFSGYPMYANDMKPIEELIALIEEFEQNEMDKAKQTLKAFSDKYGTTKDDVRAKVQAAGYEGQKQPEYKVELFQEGLNNVAKQREAEVEDIIKKAQMQIESLPRNHDFHRLEAHQSIMEWMALAERAAIDKAAVRAKTAEVKQNLDADKKSYLAKVEAREWKGTTKSKDADAALEWFKNSPDWGKRPTDARRPLAVHVAGEWSVQKHNLLGNPIMYGLPVHIAVQLDSDKPDKLVRVFNVTMRTPESADAKPQPPFDHITVGDSWFIREDKLK